MFCTSLPPLTPEVPWSTVLNQTDVMCNSLHIHLYCEAYDYKSVSQLQKTIPSYLQTDTILFTKGYHLTCKSTLVCLCCNTQQSLSYCLLDFVMPLLRIMEFAAPNVESLRFPRIISTSITEILELHCNLASSLNSILYSLNNSLIISFFTFPQFLVVIHQLVLD